MNIPLRVKNLVKKHGTNNPAQIARELNINIQYAALSGKMRGCTCQVLRRKWIIINETLDALSAEIVIAHELGHIRLHPGYTHLCHYGRRSRQENEANQFALYLLADRVGVNIDAISKIINDNRPDNRIMHDIIKGVIK